MNRHDFLVLYFCVVNFSQSIFTLEEIFLGQMFALILKGGGGIIFADRWKNRKNRKN